MGCPEEFDDLSQQQVSTALGIDRSEVVRLIDGLEESGFVIRTRDSADRRKYRLSIPQAGRAERRKTDELIEEAAERVLYRLDEDERQTLRRLALKHWAKNSDRYRRYRRQLVTMAFAHW
ncbi:MarR family winged helix-turn-helix transcriptional regulator [Nocardia sp. CA-135953]|uniref:MarR family winged helix-turn-helix transcriptional regulator n=1 Tax=Nocardia sp. CA-135953 TaxID=3239978 RepID=UPI003D97B8FE